MTVDSETPESPIPKNSHLRQKKGKFQIHHSYNICQKVFAFSLGVTFAGSLLLFFLSFSEHPLQNLSENLPESLQNGYQSVKRSVINSLKSHQNTLPDQKTRLKYDQDQDRHERILSEGVSASGYITAYTFGAVLLGGILREINKKTNIPYTPMVLVVGIIFGVVAEHIWEIGKSVTYVNNIDPHTLLLIFIPALVFESAFNTNGYIIVKSKWQILMLAGPGVVIGAVLVALTLLYILGYENELSIAQALSIGAIIATTDPVAVVALLKELGTSTKFNTLLEGESLLNDGSGMVMFLICLEVVKKGKFDLVSAIIQFIRLSIGGPVFGLIFGWIFTKWLTSIYKDSVLVVAVTFLSTYMCFFFGEQGLGLSGILALVAMGIYMGIFARQTFHHSTDHAVHVVWSFVAFVLETNLFMITGSYIGNMIANWSKQKIYLDDLWKVLVFYIILFVIRFIVNICLRPIMNCIGYKIDLKSIAVMTYGGLRGAIALALALLVVTDRDKNIDERYQDLCLFYVVVIIILTVIVNGLTIKFFMRCIKFEKDNQVKQKMKLYSRLKLTYDIVVREDEMRTEPEYQGAKWDLVNDILGLDQRLRSDTDALEQGFFKNEMTRFIKKHEQVLGKSDTQIDPNIKINKQKNGNTVKIQSDKDSDKEIDKGSPLRNGQVGKSAFGQQNAQQQPQESNSFDEENQVGHLKLNIDNEDLNDSIVLHSDLLNKSKNNNQQFNNNKPGKMQARRNQSENLRVIIQENPPLSSNSRQKSAKSGKSNASILNGMKYPNAPLISIQDELKEEKENQLNPRNGVLRQNSRLRSSTMIRRQNLKETKKVEEERQQILEITVQMRYRVYKLVKYMISERSEQYLCSQQVKKTVHQICDICLDYPNDAIFLWQTVQIYIGTHHELAKWVKWSQKKCVGGIFKKFAQKKVNFEYNLVQNLRECCNDVKKELKEEIAQHDKNNKQLEDQCDTSSELKNDEQQYNPWQKEQLQLACEQKQQDLEVEQDQRKNYIMCLESVVKELMDNIALANDFSSNIDYHFPEIVKMIKTKKAAFSLVLFEKKRIHQLFVHGQIDYDEEHKHIQKADKLINKIQKIEVKMEDNHDSVTNIMLDFPFINYLDKESPHDEIDGVKNQPDTIKIGGILTNSSVQQMGSILKKKSDFFADNLIEKSFNAKDLIYQKGQKAEYLFLVKSGMVNEILSEEHHVEFVKGNGAILNMGNLCNPDGVYMTTAIATSKVKVDRISIVQVNELMKERFEFQQYCYQMSLLYQIRTRIDEDNEAMESFQELDDSEIIKFSLQTKLVRILKGQEFECKHGGFVMKGAFQMFEHDFSNHHKAVEYIETASCGYRYLATSDCQILEFLHDLEFLANHVIDEEKKNNKRQVNDINNYSMMNLTVKGSIADISKKKEEIIKRNMEYNMNDKKTFKPRRQLSRRESFIKSVQRSSIHGSRKPSMMDFYDQSGVIPTIHAYQDVSSQVHKPEILLSEMNENKNTLGPMAFPGRSQNHKKAPSIPSDDD